MFKTIILLIFIGLLYVLLKQDRKSVKYAFLIYFSLLSIVFLSGLHHIISTYQLYDHPAVGGFEKLFSYVNLFRYLYLIPLFILIAYKLITFTLKSFNSLRAKIAMSLLWIVVLLGAMYVSSFLFILLFYGFAP
ncbi:hypothetical protein [Sporosarcina sp. USHLN248]|uniref:hypothetical protein n=1 Tax=Sporosarcina sp. USHLN248 TaxID=3081300 RepID=UPI003017AB42